MTNNFKRLFLTGIATLVITTSTFANTPRILVNDEVLPAQSYIKNSHTLVPLRAIFESLGEDVTYRNGTIFSANVTLRLNEKTANVRGRIVDLAMPAEINNNGLTMVPLRFIAEALGAEVTWDKGDISIVKKPVQIDLTPIEIAPTVPITIPVEKEEYIEEVIVPGRPIEPVLDGNEIMKSGLTRSEETLAKLVNEYRISIGQSPLTVSKSLTTVARTHVKDSNENAPYKNIDSRGIKGNGHSWSDKGSWDPVTYTPDHEYASLMWSKPSELTSYEGNGYEISITGGSIKLTPEVALERWLASSGHKVVIDGEGYWDKMNTMGIGIEGPASHIWFGEEGDPEGYYNIR